MSSPPSTCTTEPANLHWSKQDTVRLIDLYRHYPCLWNVKSDMYKDRDKCAAALKRIAEEIRKITASITTGDIKRKIETTESTWM
ncbi:putative Alcohol dehydrogenase transcription factor Myb/SANT-like-containing protein 12 [Homarus americanus]|uniref:Putative Alcohol dehydrogenase transcription factor Myb/SANT-like-containing protein 12 n=1 Tax=Homarus americanus TaxID=6706 RepID=A0A8J5JIP3_HOMAM|nr:putative Alcohol dehydrogenase transcription factor Myb/SANT-like-containing protein 12 [Homarus americanus]